MGKRLQTYRTDAIEVTFDPNRCIHFAACVRGLPAVFDSRVVPWVRPEAADAATIAEVVARCPTGALHASRLDSAEPAENAPPGLTVTATRNGPLFVRGDVEVELDDGTRVVRDVRVALCRCGKSGRQPLCDGTHRTAGFLAE